MTPPLVDSLATAPCAPVREPADETTSRARRGAPPAKVRLPPFELESGISQEKEQRQQPIGFSVGGKKMALSGSLIILVVANLPWFICGCTSVSKIERLPHAGSQQHRSVTPFPPEQQS